METLNSIEVRGGKDKRIELCHGDLTSLVAEEEFDLLIVSAFPDDYTPTPSSLIGALNRKGLSVESLARDKEIDMRKNYSCWLSREFRSRDPGLRFRRILCFEPLVRGKPPELVGDIFRALTPIVAERPDIRTAAIPVVAAGDQGYPLAAMLGPLVEAAVNWMETGLPLDWIKIIIYSDSHLREALDLFSQTKSRYQGSAALSRSQQADYDVFISYSRHNLSESEALEQELRKCRPDLKIFLDRKDIDVGSPWQIEIFETLDRCKKVVALLSPDYLASKACKEEFNIAWIRSREMDQEILFPLYLYTTEDLPTYMKYRNYFDCREGERSKITIASEKLLDALKKV
jgi:hypothetical protein